MNVNEFQVRCVSGEIYNVTLDIVLRELQVLEEREKMFQTCVIFKQIWTKLKKYQTFSQFDSLILKISYPVLDDRFIWYANFVGARISSFTLFIGIGNRTCITLSPIELKKWLQTKL